MVTQQKKQNRPYFSSSLDDLLKSFELNRGNKKELLILSEELSHRSTPRAKELEKQIAAVLEKKQSHTQAQLPLREAKPTPSAPTIPHDDESALRAEKEKTVQRISKEIEHLNEHVDILKKQKDRDKISWTLGILGFLLTTALIQVYNDISAGKADGVTQGFLAAGILGIIMLIYTSIRESGKSQRIQRLEKESAQKTKELQIFTTGKLY